MKIRAHSESHIVELDDGSSWRIYPGDIDVTLNWQPTPNLVIQPFYRFQYSWYKNASTMPGSIRNDYLNAFGITFLYSINQNLSVRTFCSYTTKSSDDAFTPAYDEVNGGIGAMLDIRF